MRQSERKCGKGKDPSKALFDVSSYAVPFVLFLCKTVYHIFISCM